MTIILRYPLLVFAISFVGMWLSVWIGKFLSKRRSLEGGVREDFVVIETSALTLLGLIVGFSFSMALSRYDQRKNYEEAEANAIGTEYLRADLLPAADAAKARVLLLKYLDQRIVFYSTRDEQEYWQCNAETARLQAALWSAVQAPAVAAPTPVVPLAVAGMNDVLDSQGRTQGAWLNRIPIAAWVLMVTLAFASNALIGFGSRTAKAIAPLLLILPLVVSIAFLLIADIDSPRWGFIQVVPENLLSLSQSLHAQ